YGNADEESRVPLALVVCSVLGAVLIGLGIILVLAHNWDEMSRSTRTVISFAPLLIGQALAAVALIRKPGSVAWAEGAGAFLALAIGSSIALVGQTYHLPGDLGSFTLTWLLLGLPIVYVLNASVPAIFYMAGTTAWTAYMFSEQATTIWFYPLAALIVPHLVIAYRRSMVGIRATWLSWAVVLSLSIVTGLALDKSMPGLWIVVYMSLFAVMYLSGTWASENSGRFWRNPYRTVGAAGIVVLAFMFSYEWPWDEIGWKYYRTSYDSGSWRAIPDYVLVTSLFILAMLLLVRTLYRGDRGAAPLGAAPVLALIAYLVGAGDPESPIPPLLFNLYVLAAGVGVTANGLRTGHLGIVNGGLAILSGWIIARFVDADMGFVARGLAFITLGSAFLITNLVLMRRRRKQA
ncbi:MAG: DUF2157 domain-containing protein, partial [Candidatus Hydrogenedentes bacterium]|nr:DUF2157 domain-containing protein [Candidatus Hydrogenedentota bacterium]